MTTIAPAEERLRQPPKDIWEKTIPRVKELLRIEFHEQGTPQWFAQRDTMLTASDVATALGQCPWETPKGLLRKKTIPSTRRKKINTAATRWGNEHEDEARQLYEEKTGHYVYQFGVIQHREHKWLGGSPDGVTATGRLLEIKCPWRRVIRPEIPHHYVPQVQILMEVLDLEVCDFVQYRPGDTWTADEYECVEVQRDRDWFRTYLPQMQKFWDGVLQARAEILDAQVVLQDRAAAVIQCAHRLFRERICRPQGLRRKEARRNFSIALQLFRNAKPPKPAPPRQRRKGRVVEVNLQDEYAIDDDDI